MSKRYWRSQSSDYFNNKRRAISGGNSRNRTFTLSSSADGGEKFNWRKIMNFFTFKNKGWRKTLLKAAGLAFIAILLFSLGAFAIYSRDLPDPDKVNTRLVAQSTKIYDRNGELLYDIFGEAKRTLISFEEMPQYIKDATVAIEDKDFYKHHGIDFTGILRSVFRYIINRGPEGGGGSTLTQQFIKNALLTNEKVFSRKIKEAVLSIQIERNFSKDEILKLYLNEVPYGNNAYGVEAASQTYFNKSASALTLAQAAYLAALPQAPTTFSSNRDLLDARKDTVLTLMRDQGFINDEQMEAAKSEEVVFSPVRNSITAPHFVLYVQELLAEQYGEKTLQEGGLQITTTLDLNLQRYAEEAVAEFAERNLTQYNASNAALAALDPRTGEVLAMVGSVDYFNDEIDGQVNVTLRPRQPGSSFKPYVYATAFKEGMSPSTMVFDVVTNFGDFGGQAYVPENFNFQEWGPVSIRQALANSMNIPAVKTILLVGVDDAIETAQDMGITTLEDSSRFGPSIVLGAGEVKLLDHVSAFGVFGTGGIRNEPFTILKITDAEGETLFEHEQKDGQRVLDADSAFLINSILSDNNARAPVFGVRNNLTLPGRPVAAKTGTTQRSWDAWTVGYTPQLAAGVWAGNNDNSSTRGGGSSIAAPIWNSFMRKALEGAEVIPFERPSTIRDIAVDNVSGKLPTQYTPLTKPEVFSNKHLPEEFDDVHIPFRVDQRTGQLADDDTPESQIVSRVYTVFHSEKPNDPAWENPVRAWALANGYSYPGIESGVGSGSVLNVFIQQPANNTTITQLPLSIAASASGPDKIEKLTIYLDGRQIFAADADKLTYFYNEPQPDGEHVLRVVATDDEGRTAQATQDITFNLDFEVVVKKPAVNATVFFPTTIEATASQGVNNLEFFIAKSGQTPIRIAGSPTKQVNGGVTTFTLSWQGTEQPDSGNYQLYARTGGGGESNRVNITIP